MKKAKTMEDCLFGDQSKPAGQIAHLVNKIETSTLGGCEPPEDLLAELGRLMLANPKQCIADARRGKVENGSIQAVDKDFPRMLVIYYNLCHELKKVPTVKEWAEELSWKGFALDDDQAREKANAYGFKLASLRAKVAVKKKRN